MINENAINIIEKNIVASNFPPRILLLVNGRIASNFIVPPACSPAMIFEQIKTQKIMITRQEMFIEKQIKSQALVSFPELTPKLIESSVVLGLMLLFTIYAFFCRAELERSWL